jgi:diphosphomevalonate decarboxylase
MAMTDNKRIISEFTPEYRTVGWQSPSNIALVKYWGKKENQIPSNPSISMTLCRSVSEVQIRYQASPQRKALQLDYSFEGAKNVKFEQRIHRYLQSLIPELPFLDQLHLKIDSRNSFPHSAGIASSASGFSALALCLCTIENAFFNDLPDPNAFLKKASFLARLGSGSAARSIYGGYTTWGKISDSIASVDEYALPLETDIHPLFRNMQDTILIVSSKEKSISSSAGHGMMVNHPYAEARFRQADENYRAMIRSLESGDMERFIRITEQEALSLHALMMSSRNGYLLMQPYTVLILERIRNYRQTTGHPVCCTLDAGPNVHLLYPAAYQEAVGQFITAELMPLCEDGRWIDDRIGEGPVQLE